MAYIKQAFNILETYVQCIADSELKESQVFVAGIPKAVLVRNENRQGRMMARNRGAKEADGHNLIFLDTSVIVSPGWIEPLVEHIQKEKSVLAVPHFDRVTDPISYEYARVTEGLTTGLSWSLAVRLQPEGVRVHVDETKPRDLPVVHGAAFAVTKIYWNQIGGYDIGLGDCGGEHLELSLRTWLCAAGTVHILPCSHVGVLNSMDPVRISAHANIHRITEVYMSSYKHLVKSFTEYDENTIADDKKTAAVQRVAEIRGMKCTHDMTWFVEKVAVDMFAPSRNATEFGLLKVGDRLCAHLGNDSALNLGSCRPASVHLRPRDMSFELLTSGELRIGDRCIECMDNAYALARQCKGGGAYAKQLWTYKDGILKNRWSNFCLMHVTDPDPKRKAEHRQIAMAQPCELDTTKNKDFSKWTLVKL